MPGIASTLNIAKEALLAHQASVSVAGHNIANVDTPGYSRQVLGLKVSTPSPDIAGFFGNGVRQDTVTRKYDQFMVQRLIDQNSTLNNLEAQQQTLQAVGTIFNEAPGLAVNELLSKFWESWQALTNNPELTSSRQTVVQQAQLLSEQFQMMATEITQARFDIGVKLKSAIQDVNRIASQIAELNGQITATESDTNKQNDLRDTRDELLKELSGYLNLSYFEGNNSSYTILMSDGHALVENNASGVISFSEDSLYWVTQNSEGETVRSKLNLQSDLGGKIGGLVAINQELSEGNPDNYLGRLDALANSIIREVNQQHTQGVGLSTFTEQLLGSENAESVAFLHTTVDVATSSETIAANTLSINGRSIGRVEGGIVTYGLAMEKTAHAAAAINNAYSGVTARMTTQVSGNAITNGLGAGESVSFTVNGVTVNYTAAAAETPAETAANLRDAINSAIQSYNATVSPQAYTPKITIEAIVGHGLNGGDVNSIILKNTNAGDESRIIIDGIDPVDPAEAKIGLSNGTSVADTTHNTGELSLFYNSGNIEIDGGSNDRFLAHLGWSPLVTYSNNAVQTEPLDGNNSVITFDLNAETFTVNIPDGSNAAVASQIVVDAINLKAHLTGVSAEIGDGTNGGVLNSVVFSSETSNIKVANYNVLSGSDILGFGNFTKIGVGAADETANDGKLIYTDDDNTVYNSLLGYDYGNILDTDGQSFEIWIYNTDGTPALSQPVSVSMERAYTLDDVVSAINTSIVNAIDDPSVTAPWVQASASGGQLILTPDASHYFAFGSDSSNFLQTAGLNTFFTGHSATDMNINDEILNNLDNITVGTINEYGEIFRGDNSNGLLITNIQRQEDILFIGGTTDTFDGHYNNLIADMGLSIRSVEVSLEFNTQVNQQLQELRDSVSGVSLDEEMSNLIRFQHAYSAAAKLLTSSDEMLRTLLDSV